MLADPAKATADQLRATWGPFVGEAGAYEITGNMITLRPLVAKNPAAEGSSIVYSYKLEGDALEVSFVSDRNGAVPYPETIKLISNRVSISQSQNRITPEKRDSRQLAPNDA